VPTARFVPAIRAERLGKRFGRTTVLELVGGSARVWPGRGATGWWSGSRWTR